MRILTVDVEDWFHILDNDATMYEEKWRGLPSRVEHETIRLLDLFDQRKTKAVFFILGYIARNHHELVQEIAHRGHEIATHGDMHQLVYQQSSDEFETDLLTSMEAIEFASGKTPRAYRAPGFSITAETPWAFEVLARNGIEIDASVFPAQRAHGGLPDFTETGPCIIQTASGMELRSFPMSTAQFMNKALVYSGGGYFRLIPQGILNYLFKNQKYVMTYFHPRDFDPDQPIVPGLNRMRRFKSYVGLTGAFNKLDRLLSTLDFQDLHGAEALIDWDKVPRVKIP